MREWLTAGRFPVGGELRVRLPEWERHMPLHQLYPDLATAFVLPPAWPDVYSNVATLRSEPPGRVLCRAAHEGDAASLAEALAGTRGTREELYSTAPPGGRVVVASSPNRTGPGPCVSVMPPGMGGCGAPAPAPLDPMLQRRSASPSVTWRPVGAPCQGKSSSRSADRLGYPPGAMVPAAPAALHIPAEVGWGSVPERPTSRSRFALAALGAGGGLFGQDGKIIDSSPPRSSPPLGPFRLEEQLLPMPPPPPSQQQLQELLSQPQEGPPPWEHGAR